LPRASGPGFFPALVRKRGTRVTVIPHIGLNPTEILLKLILLLTPDLGKCQEDQKVAYFLKGM